MVVSKLLCVQKALEEHPDVQIVGIREIRSYPGMNLSTGDWHHYVTFYAAPKVQARSVSAEGLQRLLVSCIPIGVEPTYADEFQNTDSALVYGRLFFDESFSALKADFTALPCQEIITGLQRRIAVRLFPLIEIAQNVFFTIGSGGN